MESYSFLVESFFANVSLIVRPSRKSVLNLLFNFMKVSVLLPVYNGEKYICESVSSVLKQTFDDFELIVVNDGSTDRTLDRLQEMPDPRTKIINGRHDFIRSLNKGLITARGEYVARMDADDVMRNDRLEKQVAVLDEYPDIAVCSSWIECFGRAEYVLRSYRGKIEYPLAELLLANIIFHPTVMMRNRFLKENRLRYQVYPHAEDYKLWFEIAKWGGNFWVVPEPLLRYRVSTDQVSYRKQDEQKLTTLRIRSEVLENLLYRQPHPYKKEIRGIFRKIYSLNQRELVSEQTVLQIVYSLFKDLTGKEEK